MNIKEILEQDNFITMDKHPRKCCTLYGDSIVCHPKDLELVKEGLKGFFTAQDNQKCTGKKLFFVPSSIGD